MKFTFFKIPQHRKFQHEPIYYDELKEEREERMRRVKEELGIDVDEDEELSVEQRVRGKMRRKIKNNISLVHSEKRKSNIRLAIIIFALMYLAYYLVQSSEEWFKLFAH